MELTQQNKTDLLEVVIILAMFFLIIVIYVPVAIWEEESFYEKESRYRMQTLNDIQSFFARLTGGYTSSFSEALSVVNAVRDSTIADSLYNGEQNLIINNKKLGTIRMHQERNFPKRIIGTDILNPDFIALANAYGIDASRVTETAEFRDVFEKAKVSQSATLIELIIEPNVLSPALEIGKNIG